MNSQLAGFDILFDARLLYESFGQGFLFTVSDHPSDDITAKDIHDYIEVKVSPLDRAFELGDIPGPNLIGFCGQQFRFLVMGPLMSPSSLFDTAMHRGENPVHGPNGTMILSLIQKSGVDLIGGLILESI
jgi:hypothetical protein